MKSVKIKIGLSKQQISKLKAGHKKGKDVSLRLSHTQLKQDSNEVELTHEQYKKVVSALKSKNHRGVSLTFSHKQVGGFLGTLAGIVAPMLVNGIVNATQGKNFFTGNGLVQPGGGMVPLGSKRSKKKKCR